MAVSLKALRVSLGWSKKEFDSAWRNNRLKIREAIRKQAEAGRGGHFVSAREVAYSYERSIAHLYRMLRKHDNWADARTILNAIDHMEFCKTEQMKGADFA
jgi:hypothetical protein